MVGNLLKLKLLHLGAAFRRSAWAIVGMAIGALYGLGLLAGVVGAFIAVHDDAELARLIAVCLGSLIAVAWLVVPLVASGADATLDPELLAPYPLRPRQIAGAQLAGSLIGIVGPLTLLALLAPALAWPSPLAVIVGLVSTLLGYALVVVCSRLVTALSIALRSRRFVTEAIGAVVFLAAMIAAPVIVTVGEGLASAGALRTVAEVAAWTPLGVAWSIPGDLALGAAGLAAARAVLLLAYLAAGLLVWDRVVAHQISHVGQSGGSARSTRAGAAGVGALGLFPATPAGAVAARTSTYVLKDPRMNLNLVMVPALFVLFYFFARLNEGGFQLGMVGPISAVLLTWVTCYAVSYDNTAFSLHVTAPLSGRADRWGRVVGFGVVMVPLVVAASVVSMLLAGRAAAIPVNLGLSLGIILTGLGVGAVASVRYAYPVPPPGASPWKTQRNGAGFANALAQFVGILLIALLAFPAWVPALAYLITGSQLANWLTLGIGVAAGCLVVWLGVRIGGAWYERRAPELYRDVARFT